METPVSPKVIVSVIVGIVLTAVVSNVSAITPDMFDFLGPWKLFVFGTLITGLIGVAAWWKTDPLRVLPGDASKTAEDAVSAAAAVLAAKQTSTAASAVNLPTDPAPVTSFAATQARIDAVTDPVVAAPVIEAAPEVTPVPPAPDTIA